jgi:dienelactone hydrolase
VLAVAGVVTLRLDYPQGGASGGDRARARRFGAVQEAVDWFADKTNGLGLLLIGYCYGTRLILRMATTREGIAGVALINPHLRRASRQTLPARAARRVALTVVTWSDRLRGRSRRGDPGQGSHRLLDRRLAQLLPAAASRLPVWILVGERGTGGRDLQALLPSLDARGVAVDVDVLRGIPENDPELFDELIERVSAWARSRVGEPSMKWPAP